MAFLNKKREPETEVSLHVQVFTPKGVIWEGEAQAVSSVNSQGPFDLLPEHAHFISLIEKHPITVLSAAGEKRFDFNTAVVRLIDDQVTIYADIV
jgi:F0F1-type ATP synthase epsilon subunit